MSDGIDDTLEGRIEWLEKNGFIKQVARNIFEVLLKGEEKE